MDKPLVIGSVVFSKKGRDQGSYFVVVDMIDENTVFICDGGLRKLANAKKKSVRHLKPNGVVLEQIASKLSENKKVFDSEINSALRVFNEQVNGGKYVKN